MVEITKYIVKKIEQKLTNIVTKIGQKITKAYSVQYAENRTQEQVNHSIIDRNVINIAYNLINLNNRQMKNLIFLKA
jgi:hypothetical protein